MELHQGQFESALSRYFCRQPTVEFDTNSNLHLLCNDLKISSAGQEENSDSHSSIWLHAKQAEVKTCGTHSYAMNARKRLDNLKAGCNSPQTLPAVDKILYNHNCQKDLWKKEERAEKESALDSVELLDVDGDVKDEESWLYESTKKQVFEEKTESALKWCRQVLDNPGPDVEAACRQLIHRLDDRSGSHSYRRPAVFQHTADVSMGPPLDKTSDSLTQHTSDSRDNQPSPSQDFTTTSYRLQDITDVRTMARLQEASLRQDFVSTPATASPRRGPESLPSHADITSDSVDDLTPGSKTEAPSSSCWQSGPSSPSSSSCQSPVPGAKQGCQSPRLARLQQQVTQFKLLKLAQNQATASDRTRSPLRTSLRSLQAVRNSRSLDTDNDQPADQITQPPSGASPVTKGSTFWSPSLSGASTSTSGSVGDISARIKKLQRSQSASPCRIPHSAKGYLSFRGRVFASPDRSASYAWGRNVTSTRR